MHRCQAKPGGPQRSRLKSEAPKRSANTSISRLAGCNEPPAAKAKPMSGRLEWAASSAVSVTGTVTISAPSNRARRERLHARGDPRQPVRRRKPSARSRNPPAHRPRSATPGRGRARSAPRTHPRRAPARQDERSSARASIHSASGRKTRLSTWPMCWMRDAAEPPKENASAATSAPPTCQPRSRKNRMTPAPPT